MNLRGTVHEVGVLQNISETFKKRELIIEYAENPLYPEYIKFESKQDRTGLLASLRIGDEVEVNFDIKGRSWTNEEGIKRYFNTFLVWRVSILRSGSSLHSASFNEVGIPTDDDDLPF